MTCFAGFDRVMDLVTRLAWRAWMVNQRHPLTSGDNCYSKPQPKRQFFNRVNPNANTTYENPPPDSKSGYLACCCALPFLVAGEKMGIMLAMRPQSGCNSVSTLFRSIGEGPRLM